jgi:hypothetical protein
MLLLKGRQPEPQLKLFRRLLQHLVLLKFKQADLDGYVPFWLLGERRQFFVELLPRH